MRRSSVLENAYYFTFGEHLVIIQRQEEGFANRKRRHSRMFAALGHRIFPFFWRTTRTLA